MDTVLASQPEDRGRTVFSRSTKAGARRLLVAFVTAALLLMGVFRAAEWYANEVSIPRYCDSPERTLELVREILDTREPSTGASRRPHVVAAKLIYLVPRNAGEPLGDYLDRVRRRIAQYCR